MSGFLLDTNAISEAARPRPNPGVAHWIEQVDEFKLYLSVLTIAEIRSGIEMQRDDRKRAGIETWLSSHLMSRFAGRILAFDLAIAERWGRIEGRARLGSGKLPIVDGMLAATALHHCLVMVTRNEADFSRTGVTVLNPWT